MSRRAHMPTILACTSQPRIEMSLLLALAALDGGPHTSPSAVSRFSRFFARQERGHYSATRCGSPTHCFCNRTWWPPNTKGLLLPGGDGVRRAMDPSDRCFRRAPSLPYFPCSPSVTRFGAYPAPCGTARLCFGLAALRVTAFRKSLCKEQDRKKIFRTFRKSAAWHLGAGHLASLRAGVSRGQSGQIQTGEMTWHSTKTTSS